MAELVNMPKLGFDMQEGQLVSWLKQEGDQVVEFLLGEHTGKKKIDFIWINQLVVFHLILKALNNVNGWLYDRLLQVFYC